MLVSQEACYRAAECHLIGQITPDACITAWTMDCCEGAGDCNAPVRDDFNLDACLAAYKRLDCVSMSQGAAPTECLQ